MSGHGARYVADGNGRDRDIYPSKATRRLIHNKAPRSAWVVLLVLVQRYDWTKAFVYARMRDLTADTNLSPAKVQKGIDWLEAHRVIERMGWSDDGDVIDAAQWIIPEFNALIDRLTT